MELPMTIDAPESAKVKVKLTYQGKDITWEELQKKPNVKELYPSYEQVMQQMAYLRDHTSPGMQSVLEVAENKMLAHPNAESWVGK